MEDDMNSLGQDTRDLDLELTAFGTVRKRNLSFKPPSLSSFIAAALPN